MSGGGRLVAFYSAFTLAEVLITLGIIGVVAAMTMPVLIQNARNKELEAGLKKGASTIAQALNMYETDNGEPIKPDIGQAQVKPALAKFLKLGRDCPFGYVDKVCVKSNEYKNFNGTNLIPQNAFDDGKFILSDGSLIFFENYNTWNLYISIDVNGYNKKPNRLGQDLFMFQVDKQGKLIPMGGIGTTYYSKNDDYCSKTSTNNMNGAGCTYKALSDPSFWKNLP